MSDWTSGYVADITYTYGYYDELNPRRLRLAFLHAGIAPPKQGACCELGFGQGVSINIHAAASQSQWWGTDFNPSQANFARELAEASGSDVSLFDEAFAQFCARDDLPEFSFIGLHGIWSWISNENRAVLVDFIRRKLNVGGVLYISYNTMPGWAAFAPLRDLMVEHAEVMAAPARGIVSRIDAALEFAEKLLGTNPSYARANPAMVERLKTLKEQNRHYLAHEYFNRDWHPMPFAKVAEWLEPAKVGYACSAHYIDHIDSVNFTADQQAFLKQIPDVMFRETVRDFMVNQQFRRDYWVRGPRRLRSTEQIEELRKHRIVLVVARADVSLKTRGALGEVTMHPNVYGPILDLLSDHQPKTLGEIETALSSKNIPLAQVVEAAMVLDGTGQAVAAQDDAVIDAASPKTARLNEFLVEKAPSGSEVAYLASPMTGGGVRALWITQLLLLARQRGEKTPEKMASSVWQVLSAQGHRVLKDGTALQSEQENLAELKQQAETFLDKQMPIMKALGIDASQHV